MAAFGRGGTLFTCLSCIVQSGVPGSGVSKEGAHKRLQEQLAGGMLLVLLRFVCWRVAWERRILAMGRDWRKKDRRPYVLLVWDRIS